MSKVVDFGQYGSLEFDDTVSTDQIKEYIADNEKKISNQLNIPPEPTGGGPISFLLPDSVERGLNSFLIGSNILQMELGLDNIDNAVYDIRRYQQRQNEIPLNTEDAQTLQKITEADSLGEAISAFGDNMSVVFPLIGESIGTYLPTIALGGGAALATRGLMGRIVGALTTGSGSGATEYGLSFIDSFNQAGVDINDGGELAKALDDEETMDKAREYATKRGVPIGAFDSLAFGTAGLITNALKTGAKVGLGRRVAAGLGEIGQGASFGMLGEAAAQVLSTGEITSPGAVFLEGIAEGPMGLVEAGFANLKKNINTEDDLSGPLLLPYQPIKQIGFTTKIEDKNKDARDALTPEEGPKQLTFQPKIEDSNKRKREDTVGPGMDRAGKKAERQRLLKRQKDGEMNVRSRIFNFVSDLVERGTNDLLNYRKITPRGLLKVLGNDEQNWLNEFTNDEGMFFISQTLDELVKINKLNKRDLYTGERTNAGLTKTTIYETLSPLDRETIKKVDRFEQKKKQRQANPKVKKEKLQYTAPRLESQVIEENRKPLHESIKGDVKTDIKDLDPNAQERFIEYFNNPDKSKAGFVKNIHAANKNNEVVGQLQDFSIDTPGRALNVTAAINLLKPENTKIFHDHQEAKEYLNKQLDKETIDTNQKEIIEEINEEPNFSMENIEDVTDREAIGAFEPPTVVPTIPELAAQSNIKRTKSLSQKTDKEKSDAQTEAENQPVNIYDDQTSINANEQVDLLRQQTRTGTDLTTTDTGGRGGDRGGDDGGITPPPEGPRGNQNRKDISDLENKVKDQNKRIDRALDLFSGPLNALKKLGSWFTSATFISRDNPELAAYTTFLQARSESRSNKMEEQAELLSPWNKLTPTEQKLTGLAAVYSKTYKTILTPDANGQIIITAEQYNRGKVESDRKKAAYDQAIAEGLSIEEANQRSREAFDPENRDSKFKPVGTTLINLTGTINEDIILNPNAVAAYQALDKVQTYRRNMVVKQTVSQLRKLLATTSFNYNRLALFSEEQLTTTKGINQISKAFYEFSKMANRTDPGVAITFKHAARRLEIMAKNSDTLYFPLSRNGDKFVAVTENVLKSDGTIKKESVSWSAFDTKDGNSKIKIREAQDKAEALIRVLDPNELLRDDAGNIVRENGKAVKKYLHSGVKGNTYNNMKMYLPADFYTSLEAFIALMPSDLREGNIDYEQIMKSRAKAAQEAKGTPTFFREARLIPGYDFKPENIMESLNSSITSFATWDSHFEYETDINSAYESIVEDNSGATTEREKEYVEKLNNYLKQDPLELQGLRQLGFLYYLTDVSASVMNMFQGIPAATYISMYGGVRKAGLGQARATKDIFKLLKSPKEFGKFKSDLAIDLNKVVKKYGTKIPRLNSLSNILGSSLAPSRVNEYLASNIGSIMNETGMNANQISNRKGEKMIRLLGSMFTTTEVVNRLASYINSYELTTNNDVLRKAIEINSKDQNFSAKIRKDLNIEPEAILNNFNSFISNNDNKEALRDIVGVFAVEETQFVYGKEAKPAINRGLGALLFQFSEYPTMMMQLMYKMATGRGKEGKQALALYGIALILTSGMMGLPFMEDGLDTYEGVYNFATKRNLNIEKEYFKLMADITSPEMADAMARGFLRYAGVDIGRRVGLGSHPITGFFNDAVFGDTGLNQASIPAVSVIRGFVDSKHYLGNDDIPMAVASVLPKPFQNIIKSGNLGTQGYKTKSGEQIVVPENISTQAQVLQFLGFSPVEISRAREYNYLQKSGKFKAAQLRDQFYTRQNRALTNLNRAIENNDLGKIERYQKQLDEVRKDVAEHNQNSRRLGEYDMVIDLDPATVRRKMIRGRLGIDALQTEGREDPELKKAFPID